jgi:Gas vesicle protein G
MVGTLLLLPFMAPVWGFRFVLQRLSDEAESVLRDEGRGFAELIDLSMRHKAGKLSDAEFAEQESALLARLGSIREYKEELLRGELEGEEFDWPEGEEIEVVETPC